ncbi:MOSC domain-containing protein [Saccharopolyspora montiporae]|uniref:MOSC domain-containing protein n=1 Tax=Saccharopolyspora montiporae TaxID=2781240 RepID=UPI00351C7612
MNVAQVRTGGWTGRVGRTGIDKRPVSSPVVFGPTGVGGDAVCDTRHHGAWYQAAYAFDLDELEHWSQRLDTRLVPGNAGENLTLHGFDSSSAVLGQRLRIGGAVLRVTGPRTPCSVFAGFWDEPRLVRSFTERGRTGAYFAVEEAGEVAAGDVVQVLSTPEHGVRVHEVFAVNMHGRADLAEHVRGGLGSLPEAWRDQTTRSLRRYGIAVT